MKTIYLFEKKSHWSYRDEERTSQLKACLRRDKARRRCDVALGAVLLAKVDSSHPDPVATIRAVQRANTPKDELTPMAQAWAASFEL